MNLSEFMSVPEKYNSFTVWSKRHPVAFLASTYLVVLIIMAVFAPLFSGYLYDEVDLSQKNLSPSAAHWFGTDDLGRDMFTRIWYGARISLFVGFAAAAIDMVVGVLWGGIAALSGGKIDEVMMRFVDIISAIPSLLIIISLIVVIGSGLHTIIIAIALLGWITMARVVRGQLIQLKEQGYVLAARSLGASFWRILFRHLLPNAAGPIVVTLTLTIPSAIFTEAFLSYLGLGVQAPIASWGTMASDGLPAMQYYPWRLFFPAAFISMTMLAFNLVSNSAYGRRLTTK
ncbi:MAG: ABC transporter permease [Parachlamydiaceae bacterium]